LNSTKRSQNSLTLLSQPIPCFRDDFSSFRAKLTLTERDEETALRLPTFNEILPGELERRLDGLCR
jgi:hypothetical protein